MGNFSDNACVQRTTINLVERTFATCRPLFKSAWVASPFWDIEASLHCLLRLFLSYERRYEELLCPLQPNSLMLLELSAANGHARSQQRALCRCLFSGTFRSAALMPDVLFSNRPSGSSTFRLSITAMSCRSRARAFSSNSAPGPFHHGIRGQRNNLLVGLAVEDGGQAARYELTSSIRPAGDIFPPLGGASISRIGSGAAVACFSGPSELVPSTLCMQSRRPRAKSTIAFFIPRAWLSAWPSLEPDHFFECIMR